MQQATMLSGKRAIVTGGASGIGKAIVEAFVEAGATVLSVDLPSDSWTDSEAIENGVARLAIDVTGAVAPAAIVAAALKRLGGIDILVNNAGLMRFGGADNASDEDWAAMVAVNVTAPFLLTREAVPHLKEGGNGCVINTGSIMSELAGPGIIAYVTTKHAIAGMTKAMAIDLGQYGIRANFLQPGAVETPLSAPHMSDPDYVGFWERKIPLGRVAQPEEIAPVAVFLASDAANYVSGEGLRIDGGATYNI